MNNVIVGVVFALVLAVCGLGYVAYGLAQTNGELSTQLETATEANSEWEKVYKATVLELNGRQARLDLALAADAKNMQDAAKNSNLFRTEIDSLKAKNGEYKKLLETRLPDPLLIRLCDKGYAAPSVCKGLLPVGG